jgi:hypothetical protein
MRNVKTIVGKEVEITKEMERDKIQVLGISEVKKKRSRETTLEKGSVLRYLGVEKRRRAKDGVGIIMDETTDKNVIKWTPMNSRIIRVDLHLEGNRLTVVQVYAPTEDADIIEKEQLYLDLQRVADDARTDNRKLVIMGDMNGRNGQDQRVGHGSMGRYGGERIRNTNEERLIDFCINNGLLIGNTFYNHKQIHKITFEGEGRDVKSITDYILYSVELTYVLKDVKVIRGTELSTDHRLLVTDTRFRKGLPEKTKKYQKFFTEKLKREEHRKNTRKI